MFSQSQSDRPLWILLTIAASLLLFFTIAFQGPNSNVWSRLATATSLVERGTLAIDGDPTTNANVDKVLVRGRFYSDKPPAMSLLLAGLYYPLHLLGFQLSQGRNVAYVFSTFALIGGSTLLCLFCFYRALGLIGLPASTQMLMSAGLAFGTLLFPWSTAINNHSFSGSWTFVAFYFLLRAKLGPPEKVIERALMAGAAAGLAATADSACALFVVAFGIYILFSREVRRGLPGYIILAFLVMLPGIVTSYLVTGDLRPIAVHQEYFHYPGSYWDTGYDHLSGVEPNDLPFAAEYAFECLFGPNGFLLYNPLLFIALLGAGGLIAGRKRFWVEASMVLALSAMFTGYFFFYSSNFAGHSYSIRWFVTLIPLLWFFAFPFFLNLTRTRRCIYGALCSVSFVIAIVGAVNQSPPTLRFPDTPAIVLNWRMELKPRLKRMMAWLPRTSSRP